MSYIHLSRDDRIRLDVLLRTGLNITECARRIDFSRQTVSYEINTNSGRKRYNPYIANKKAKKKHHKANQCKRKWHRDSWYVKVVIRLLKKGWSPEQIIGRLELEKKVQPFSVNTIYYNINSDKELRKLLPRRHNKYRRRKDGNEHKKSREKLDTRRSIDQRPRYIEKRKSIGHFEGDTIIGKERTARILTHVERKTGYLLADILYSVSAEKISIRSIKGFDNIPDRKKKTITYDRGSEFADWELTERETELDVYFANAYHSWERGTNENTNGLVRRYYPKKTLFNNIKREELQRVVEQINYRPRKRLGYKTPYEVFNSVKLRTIM